MPFFGVIISLSMCSDSGPMACTLRWPGNSITSAFRTHQSLVMGEVVQSSFRPSELTCPRESPESDGAAPAHRGPGQTSRFPQRSATYHHGHSTITPWAYANMPPGAPLPDLTWPDVMEYGKETTLMVLIPGDST